VFSTDEGGHWTQADLRRLGPGRYQTALPAGALRSGRFMRDPSNGNLSVREVVEKRAPSLQAGADDSARFDRALADYRQIIDHCVVRTP
jgi:hypothetical protein